MAMLKGRSLAIILAAGLGTRMRSNMPKVMHAIGSVPMIRHVLATASAVSDDRAVVIGPDMGDLAAEIAAFDAHASHWVQRDRLGTAHAVAAARQAIADEHSFVFVMFGDTPLISAETLGAARGALEGGADVCVLGFMQEDPTGYGRLLTDGERLIAIREHAAATPEEKLVKFCNSGVMGFRAQHLLSLVDAIGQDNPKNEFYLTDAVEIANQKGLVVQAQTGDGAEFLGINSRSQLAEAEAVFQEKRRQQVMANGATLVSPETVFFAPDTQIGTDVLIEPNVIFGAGVTVGDNTTIRAFSHIEGAEIGKGVQIGPFARIRPGTKAGDRSKIGNFVETKKANIGTGAKLNHLSYLGDAEIGEKANIGAGTITCNYDGFDKFTTTIGAGAFIGSNSALVAPVQIGEGAYVASGSIVTSDVSNDALAIARAMQVEKPDWALRFREKKAK